MGLVGGVRACWSCESCACRLVFVSSHATAELYIYIDGVSHDPSQAACPTQSASLCVSPADRWYPVPTWNVAVGLARPPSDV